MQYSQRGRLADQIARVVCFVCAILLVGVIIAVFVFIGSKSFKIFSLGADVKTFFTVDNWDPTGANTGTPAYGGFGLILGSIVITLGSIIIVTPLALLFTMGTNNPGNVFTLSLMIASDTLTTRLYYLKQQGIGTSGLNATGEATLDAGIAATLILLLLIINVVARVVGRQIQRKLTAA